MNTMFLTWETRWGWGADEIYMGLMRKGKAERHLVTFLGRIILSRAEHWLYYDRGTTIASLTRVRGYESTAL